MNNVIKYSILTYIMNDYEMVREPLEVSDNAEYILVTDNPKLKSEKWTIKLIPEWLNSADGFTKSFYVRYHPFEFVNTDTCVVLDSSIHIKKSLDKLLYDFNNSNSECLFMVHWNQYNAWEQYGYWQKERNYPANQITKVFSFFKAIGYSKEYKGAFETGFKIVKKTNNVNMLHEFVYACLEKLGDKLHVDRVDQGIFTAVINTEFNDLKIMPATHQIIQNDYMTFYNHNTWKPYPVKITKQMYLFNKKINVYEL